MAAAKMEGAEGEEVERKERVKARWSMLRQALLGSSPSGGDAGGESAAGNVTTNDVRFHEQSMNYFSGFQVLDRTVLSSEDREAASSGASGDGWDIVRYSYTSTKGYHVQFSTRETKTQQQSSQKSTVQSRAEALLSHRKYGVDNTGNVRVWDAEGTLAGFLLSAVLDGDDAALNMQGYEQSAALPGLRKYLRSTLTNKSAKRSEGQQPSCNVLELGAGQAGLAGLAMAAAVSCTKNTSSIKPLHVVLTDGHPKCVENNAACAKMLPTREDSTSVQIDARLLLWDSSSNGAEACHEINQIVEGNEADDEGRYQICFASDCVHFQEFHDGLLTTIARTLTVGGMALLCQPSRGSSVDNFMALVDAANRDNPSSPLFQVGLFEDFHPKVSARHKELVLESIGVGDNVPKYSTYYDPNRHRPLLLVLRKLRHYHEAVDGEVARHHVKTRKK